MIDRETMLRLAGEHPRAEDLRRNRELGRITRNICHVDDVVALLGGLGDAIPER